MRLFNFASVKLTLCLCLGILFGFYIDLSSQIPLGIIIVLFPLLYWAKKKQSRKGVPFFEVTTIFIIVLLGVLIVNVSQSKNLQQHYSKNQQDNPKQWELKIREVLKPNPYTQRYVVNVLSIENKKSAGKLILSLPVDSSNQILKIDDELFVFSKITAISPPLNQHQFDYRDYLKKQGIHFQITANYNSILLQENPSKSLTGMALNFREEIISKLKKKSFGTDELGVIQALLLGKRSDISESTYNNYKNAGAVHILAVSGLHVGVLLLLLQFLLSPLERFPKGKNLKLPLIVLLLWAYAFLAGLSPSIVRAVTMFSFLAYAQHLNRPSNSFNILALSMFFILLVKPLFLFQVGFQMSYAAVFAIVWVYPKLQRFWSPKAFIIRKTWQLLSVSIAAQLGVLPISLFYFHQFPALFFVSNLLTIPFLGLILGFGILVILLAILDCLPNFMAFGYNAIIQIMNEVIGWVATQEGFIIKDIPFDTMEMVLAYALILAIILFFTQPRFKNVIVIFVCLVLLQLWSIWNQFQLHQKEVFMIMHKSKNTVILHQTGKIINLYTNDSVPTISLINNYKVAERIESLTLHSLKNSYTIAQKRFYVMDSFGIYPENKNHDFLLLTQSPKIHLERLLDSIRPKMVIADGSNYKSYISRWKQTCFKKEIPFHSTSEKGSYKFNLPTD